MKFSRRESTHHPFLGPLACLQEIGSENLVKADHSAARTGQRSGGAASLSQIKRGESK